MSVLVMALVVRCSKNFHENLSEIRDGDLKWRRMKHTDPSHAHCMMDKPTLTPSNGVCVPVCVVNVWRAEQSDGGQGRCRRTRGEVMKLRTVRDVQKWNSIGS